METATIRDRTHNFAPGDNIEVTEGELVNLRGRVLSVDGDKVVIRPDHEDLKVRYKYVVKIVHLLGVAYIKCF